MGLVIVGKIVNTRGLKGEVKIVNYSDFPEERYQKDKVITVYNEVKDKYFKYTINNVTFKDNLVYLTFKEVKTIETAEKLKNYLIVISKEELTPLEEDNFYHHELIGLDVYYKGSKIGVIEEISTNTAQDLIRVREMEKSYLVPFMEEFVEEVNIKENKIVLINLEGLRWK